MSNTEIDSIIDSLWEKSAHGTTREDVIRIWNAAIEQAAKVVQANFDEQEPWVEVSDIESLYLQPKN